MTRQAELAALFRREGFTCLRTGRHAVWGHPVFGRLSTSASPSDANAVRHAAQDIARLKRGQYRRVER